jgi:hypothetical protein
MALEAVRDKFLARDPDGAKHEFDNEVKPTSNRCKAAYPRHGR